MARLDVQVVITPERVKPLGECRGGPNYESELRVGVTFLRGVM